MVKTRATRNGLRIAHTLSQGATEVSPFGRADASLRADLGGSASGARRAPGTGKIAGDSGNSPARAEMTRIFCTGPRTLNQPPSPGRPDQLPLATLRPAPAHHPPLPPLPPIRGHGVPGSHGPSEDIVNHQRVTFRLMSPRPPGPSPWRRCAPRSIRARRPSAIHRDLPYPSRPLLGFVGGARWPSWLPTTRTMTRPSS